MKICTKCLIEKPYDAFSKGPRYRDGYQSYCKECMRNYHRQRKADPEKHRADLDRSLAWHYKTTEERERDRQKREQHRADLPERMRAYDKQRSKNANRRRGNIARNIAYEQRVKADPRKNALRLAKIRERENKQYQSSPDFRHRKIVRAHRMRVKPCKDGYTRLEWETLCARYDHCCLCCKERKPLTADHVIPLSRGGSNTIENLQPLCLSCNDRKHTKTTDYRPLWEPI